MAAGDPILDLSDLINLATGGGGGTPEQINWLKKGLVAGAVSGANVAGKMQSLWRFDSSPCGGVATLPTTSVVTTNATDGSLKQATSAAGAKKRLLSFSAVALVAGTLILFDRLNQSGGLSGTTTTAQSTNLPTAALTRRTTGLGVEQWLEIHTAIGGTGTTVTTSYTDDGGTTGNVGPLTTFGGAGANEAQRMIPLPLATGDKGVRAVASATVTATTGTAGAFGVVLAYPLVVLPLGIVGAGNIWSAITQIGGPLDLGATSDACLSMAWLANAAGVNELFGQAFFMEK